MKRESRYAWVSGIDVRELLGLKPHQSPAGSILRNQCRVFLKPYEYMTKRYEGFSYTPGRYSTRMHLKLGKIRLGVSQSCWKHLQSLAEDLNGPSPLVFVCEERGAPLALPIKISKI